MDILGIRTTLDVECLKKTLEVLIDNGVQNNEAKTVLIAIGQTLLDVNLDEHFEDFFDND